MERSAVDRVVYLHGFRSSPASAKGRELAAAAAEWNADFSAPDLNLSPREADALVGSLLSPLSAQARRSTLRAYGWPTAVVNPCLMPWDFVPQQVGLQTIFGTNRTIMVKPGFADEFRELAAEMPAAPLDPADALVLLSTADETLDWHIADRALRDSPKVLSTEDDHRMQRFAECLPAVRGFFMRRKIVPAFDAR